MKKRVFSPRNLIIMFAPVVFVLVTLNLGLPQQLLTAVRVGGEAYSTAEYNYYFCTEYYGFVADHADELEALGLNTRRSLKKQSYSEGVTWRDHFRSLALARMQEYAVLRGEAEAAGFTADAAVAEACSLRARDLEDYCVNYGVSGVDSYLTSYYDAGMTQEIYYEQLGRQTLAEAYRAEVLEQLAPGADQVEAYRRANLSGQDYDTADVVVSFFSPAADRTDGLSGERQWDNAETLARTALERANGAGGDLAAFEEMAGRYSQLADGPARGRYPQLRKDGLDEALSAWCFDPARVSGDAAVLRGEAGWYLVYFNGWGDSSLTVEARDLLLAERYAQWLDERAAQWPVSTSAIPMLIAK